MSDILHERLETRPWLLADGAMGTNLFAMGLQTGEPPELWNVDHPDRIAATYRGFVEAGADIILTNSFGGNRYRLKLHGNEHRVAELNRAAARIAREVVAATRPEVIVAGSMGPTGEIYAPLGPLEPAAAREAYREQAAALVEGGADVLWVETISSREEMEAAVEGASTTGKPVVCTLSFDTNGRTMMGLAPSDVAAFAATLAHPPVACGSNCGVGPAETVLTVLNMARAAQRPELLVAKGNCGIPQWAGGHICYDGTPELMAAYARRALAAGARIIGGCCGTTPGHLRAMRAALESCDPQAACPPLEELVAELGQVSTGARAQYGGDLSVAGGSASGGGARRGRRAR
jgi:5-methyltetrahydrofolate--homocysteine methyltransferase